MAIGTGLALAIGSGVSAAAQSAAAKKGAKATQAATDATVGLQRDMWEQTSKNLEPRVAGGNDAFSAILYEMGLGPLPEFGGSTPEIKEVITKGRPADQSLVSLGRDGRDGLGGNRRTTQATKDVTTYLVGDQSFETRSAAEEYAKAHATKGTPYKGYSASPMAKYLLETGTDAIEGSAAAGGGLYSGATLQAIEDNRRRVIGADTADYFSRLMGISSSGQNAAAQQGAAGQSYASNAGNAMMMAANAKAQGYQGAADAISSGIGDMAGIYGYFNNPMAAYAAPTLAPATSIRPRPRPF